MLKTVAPNFSLGITDIGHQVCTVVWVSLAVLLLYFQGLSCQPLQVIRHLVQRRWLRRLLTCPRLPTCPRLWFVLICFSAVALLWSMATGFLQLGPPKSLISALLAFPFVFFTIALLEESLFRGVLVRLPRSERPSLPTVHLRTFERSESNDVMAAAEANRANFVPSLSGLGETWIRESNSVDSRDSWRTNPDTSHLHASGSDQSCDICTDELEEGEETSEASGEEERQEDGLEKGGLDDTSISCSCLFRRVGDFETFCHPSRPLWYESVGNVVIFTLYHMGDWHPSAVFQDWRFLVDVIIVGACCQELLIRTQSLWPSVAFHCVMTWVWLNFGGGMAEVTKPPPY